MTTPSSRSTSTPRPPMNQYGRLAMDQWERHRPNEVAAMADPLTEFTNLGRLIANEISIETTTRLTTDPTLNRAEVETEVTEIVLNDLVWSQTTQNNSDSTSPVDETLVEEIPIAFDDTKNLQRWAASPLTQPTKHPPAR